MEASLELQKCESFAASLKAVTDSMNDAGETPTDQQLDNWSRTLKGIQGELQETAVSRLHVYGAVAGNVLILAILFIWGTPLHQNLLHEITLGRLDEFRFLWWSLEGQAGHLVALSILAGVWGMAGGCINSISALSARYARGTLLNRYLLHLWTKPVRGAFIGAILFMLIQAGLLTFHPETPTDEGQRTMGPLQLTYTIFALSALAGFQERGFIQKLEDIIKALLGVRGEEQQARVEQQGRSGA